MVNESPRGWAVNFTATAVLTLRAALPRSGNRETIMRHVTPSAVAGSMLLLASHALAQTAGGTGTGPAPSGTGTAAGATATNGLGSYWWILLVVLAVAVALWMMRGRGRPGI